MTNYFLLNLTYSLNLQDFWYNLVDGEITWLTALCFLAIAIIMAIVGGAIGGILLAAKDLGYSVATTIGGLFGMAGVVPTVAIALVVLKFII